MATRTPETEKPGISPGQLLNLAGPTGLEPATSCVTGRRSNQLNYDPVQTIKKLYTAFPRLTTANTRSMSSV
jgi:hypothetical protein